MDDNVNYDNDLYLLYDRRWMNVEYDKLVWYKAMTKMSSYNQWKEVYIISVWKVG